jgi:prevent-host-death family protein
LTNLTNLHRRVTLRNVNLYDAKTRLSKLVDRAADGEEIVIAKAGRPMARLGPLKKVRSRRKAGFLRGKVRVSDDFDAPLPPEFLLKMGGK